MLKGKNAIVTGARTGIGRAILNRFAHDGLNVWAIVRRYDEQWLNDIKILANQCNVWIRPVYIDLSNDEQIKQGIHLIIKEKLSIDILVNAAGIVSENCLIQMTSVQTMRDVMQVNFFAPIQLCQLISRVMCRQKCGAIINVGSIAVFNVDLGQVEYVASKAALIYATKKMAKEWGKYGIRVNAVAPGIIDTRMIQNMNTDLLDLTISNIALKTKGNVESVADVCSFLASDKSSYITGQVLRVDGGM